MSRSIVIVFFVFTMVDLFSFSAYAQLNENSHDEIEHENKIHPKLSDSYQRDFISTPKKFFLQVESKASIAGAMLVHDKLFGSAAYGVHFGFRSNKWDFFANVEHGFFGDENLGAELINQTLNLGLGVGLRYFDNYLRSSIILGSSILLTDSMINQAGTFGLYIDARPIGFRIPIGKIVVIEIHPLTFSLINPVVKILPLVYVNYRTVLAVEFIF